MLAFSRAVDARRNASTVNAINLHIKNYAMDVRNRALTLMLEDVRRLAIENIKEGKRQSRYPVAEDRSRPGYVPNRAEKSITIFVENGVGRIGYNQKAFYMAAREKEGLLVYVGKMRFPDRHRRRKGKHPIVRADMVIQVPGRPLSRAFQTCMARFNVYLDRAVKEVQMEYARKPESFFKITDAGRKVYIGGNVPLRVRLQNNG